MSFSYTSSQRKGILFLLFIVGFLALYKLIHNSVINNQKILPLEFIKIDKKQSIDNEIDYVKNINELDKNPNDWIRNDWKSIGLSEKQINTVLNFKKKLGGFKSKEQLFSCYVLDDFHKKLLDSVVKFEAPLKVEKSKQHFFKIYQLGKPNYQLNLLYDSLYYMKKDGNHCYFLKYSALNIKKHFNNKSITEKDIAKLLIDLDELTLLSKPKNRTEVKIIYINMNTADTNQWKSFNGIGSKRANRIVKYRRLLGGFVSKNQLSEIYGLSDSLIEEIKPKLMLDSLKLNKININDASKKELATHPYISWNLANAILNYKVQHGDYDSLSKIKQIHLVNDDLYRKIVPYISLD